MCPLQQISHQSSLLSNIFLLHLLLSFVQLWSKLVQSFLAGCVHQYSCRNHHCTIAEESSILHSFIQNVNMQFERNVEPMELMLHFLPIVPFDEWHASVVACYASSDTSNTRRTNYSKVALHTWVGAHSLFVCVIGACILDYLADIIVKRLPRRVMRAIYLSIDLLDPHFLLLRYKRIVIINRFVHPILQQEHAPVKCMQCHEG